MSRHDAGVHAAQGFHSLRSDDLPEVRELVGWNECRSRSRGAGWKRGEQEVVTMASPWAVAYHDACQEDEPVHPDDNSAIRPSGGEGELELPM